MQRYFVSSAEMNDSSVTIIGDDANHIVKVMRMEIGDHVICSDNQGRVALCEITEIDRDTVQTSIIESIQESKESPIRVTIAQGIPKGDKLETIVQKGTELGAMAFLPFSSSRCIVKWDEKKGQKKTQRLEKIAKEAAEQSHRSRIPDILSPVSFKSLLKQAAEFDYKIVAYEEEAKIGETKRLSELFNQMAPGTSILCAIGPEGGLSEQEVDELKEADFIPCGLGPRILRTETASSYILSAISYHFELMR
ncbi:16S rRNA (uracil(1498)-N(3))-methyltransferase [Fictibacillus sp. WQ 8-8]|uniref:16S rRNA (uracil(1498)-N(3))-methyltransferase n=1 Tax=Fictibacillus sp. WQ 8-8 TaxID=2938788 RepID=UPI002109968C|nr:16S rRNA (uracil(1498)-N(3))-methyltransferase [Fictibacillus sp. WQ 8-8]MCQ6266279.1 16S rRNA (uracil(1498)-N(3))-methyltransferase [Fictibacillus sp. WQ 8-8]